MYQENAPERSKAGTSRSTSDLTPPEFSNTLRESQPAG